MAWRSLALAQLASGQIEEALSAYRGMLDLSNGRGTIDAALLDLCLTPLPDLPEAATAMRLLRQPVGEAWRLRS